MFTEEQINNAKKIIKKYSSTFYIATLFFPKKERYQTWIFYAFVRTVDEIVDTDFRDEEAKVVLHTWWEDWKNNPEKNIIQQSTRILQKEIGLEEELFDAFFKSMEKDTEKHTYSDYKEVENYMYGSAVIIGYAMGYITKAKGIWKPHAKAMAEMFQLVNFIRDARSDYEERGRIYLPQNELYSCGLNQSDFIKQLSSEEKNQNWITYMNTQEKRTRELGIFGREGIRLLPRYTRFAVLLSYNRYSSLLNKIKKNNYTINKRTSLNKKEKFIVFIKTILNKYE